MNRAAQIQRDAGKLIGQRFRLEIDNRPKHTVKDTQDLLKQTGN